MPKKSTLRGHSAAIMCGPERLVLIHTRLQHIRPLFQNTRGLSQKKSHKLTKKSQQFVDVNLQKPCQTAIQNSLHACYSDAKYGCIYLDSIYTIEQYELIVKTLRT